MTRQAVGRGRSRIFRMGSACVLLASCTPGPLYETPGMRLPDRYSMLMPVAVSAEVDPRWWLAFKDPILVRLIDEGLTGSLTLAEARVRVTEAEALARRAGWPVTGDGRIERTGGNNQSRHARDQPFRGLRSAGRAFLSCRGGHGPP